MLAQPWRRRKGRPLSAVIALMAAAGGCITPQAPPGTGAPAPLPPGHDSAVSGPAARASVEILSATMTAGAAEASVQLTSSAPLIWTSWRDSAGRVVVELPGAALGPGFTGTPPPEGLVTGLELETEVVGLRPLTRLVIATREESEHAVRAEGSVLHIRLVAKSVERNATASRPR